MKRIRSRMQWTALTALVLILAACKGESPTAPQPGGGPGGGPGTTPPTTGISITVTPSTTTTTTNQTVQVTAAVQVNGAAAPNGTAVEFTTTHGTFADTGTNTTLRTTTNGSVTVGLTAATSGNAVVTAQIGTARGSSPSIRFNEPTVDPPQPNRNPTVTGISPQFGQPTGGETVRITGTNFRGRVRVFFDVGENTLREAQVVNVTATTIDVITPAVQLTPGGTLVAPVTVVVDADTANEVRLTTPQPFTYRLTQLTPSITTVSPNSGNVNGGTRVTIFGNSFQAPVQVLFGLAEAQVVETFFDKIIVMSPPARATTGDGSEPTTGTVEVTVVNINSGTRASLTSGFRYTPGMAITAISPNQGSFEGGTRVTIDGIGFEGPVAVSIAGIAATPVFVSGTRIIVETNGIAISSCADQRGVVTVTNINSGVSAEGPEFIYRVFRPAIAFIDPDPAPANAAPNAGQAVPGQPIHIDIVGVQPGPVAFQIGTTTVFGTVVGVNPDGTTRYQVIVPTNITFTTTACTTTGGLAGTQQQPVTVNVVYTNLVTTCTTTLTQGLIINPPNPTCTPAPPPQAVLVSPTTGNCADAGSQTAASGTRTTTIIFRNDGGRTLTVTPGSVSGTNAGDFTVTPASSSIAPNATGSFTVTFDPSATGVRSGSVTFSTNDPDAADQNVTVCLTGTGT